MIRVYLAGPMSGIPRFNFPAFFAAAAVLRSQGFDVVSPAETDPPDVRVAALASVDGKTDASGKVGHETWGDMLARDVKYLADGIIGREIRQEDGNILMPGCWPARGIVFLPGWHKSRGARLEAFVGTLTGKRFFEYDPVAEYAYERDLYWLRSLIDEGWPR